MVAIKICFSFGSLLHIKSWRPLYFSIKTRVKCVCILSSQSQESDTLLMVWKTPAELTLSLSNIIEIKISHVIYIGEGTGLPFFLTFYYKLTQCSKINVVLSDYFSWFERFGISLCWKKAVLKNKEPDTVMTVNQRKRKLLCLLFSLLANLYFLNWEKVTKRIMTVLLPTHCCCVYRDCNVVGVWAQFWCMIS